MSDETVEADEIEDAGDEGQAASGSKSRRTRRARQFPALSFAEACALPEAIQEHGAGQPIRRTTLFDKLERSPEGGTTRKLITSSVQYGLTKAATPRTC